MPKYRKKPIVIEAIQFTGDFDQHIDLHRFFGGTSCQTEEQKIILRGGDKLELKIQTLEGTMECLPGDWIVKGTQGEFYPVKDKIFKEIYEKVEGGCDDWVENGI